MRREYRYVFDDVGRVRCDSDEVWQSTASTWLDGVWTPTWLGPFGSCERDILRVMAAVLEADRLSPRRPSHGKRAERDLAWQRSLDLHVTVESPERWTAASPVLTRLLSFMTDDAWQLHFDGTTTILGQQPLLPFRCIENLTEVALFSGGLDSAAGLFARNASKGGHFLAVSACGNAVHGNAQRAAWERLRSLGVAASWLKIDHHLCGVRRPRSRMEPSQRSRGLLFLAMGAAAASQLQMPTFSVYETGPGCINLPTSAAQVGAQGTRAMHPRTLALFAELLDEVFDRPVRAVVPFFLHTKGELCRLAGPALGRIAQVSMSCDEGEGHKPDAMLHCGLCTSCLFRRIALHASGLMSDPTKYRDVSTKRHGVYELQAFEHHAMRLSACRTFTDLIDLDPDIRFATTLPLPEAPPIDAAGASVFALYQRYATEIQAFLDDARPTIARRSQQPRKEGERDLFAAAR